jgi:hypothetical protein
VSWFYILHQSTHEALLLEALVLLALVFFYAVFWLVEYKKHRFETISHLNDQATFYLHEVLRFSALLRLEILGNRKTDLNTLEIQLAEERKITATLEQEKKQLQALLETAQKNALEKEGANSSSANELSGTNSEMQEKIKDLEEKIQEYALLQEDLAHLKEISEENKKLKKLVKNTAPTPSAPKNSVEKPPEEPQPESQVKPEPDLLHEFEKMLKN